MDALERAASTARALGDVLEMRSCELAVTAKRTAGPR